MKYTLKTTLLLVYCTTLWLTIQGEPRSPYDCRRFIYAPGCRGIIAKRDPISTPQWTLNSKTSEDPLANTEDSDLLDSQVTRIMVPALIVMQQSRTPLVSESYPKENYDKFYAKESLDKRLLKMLTAHYSESEE